jgi:hypothetical protein
MINFLKPETKKTFSGWKTTILTSVFLSPTSVKNALGAPHGTTLMDFADVDGC